MAEHETVAVPTPRPIPGPTWRTATCEHQVPMTGNCARCERYPLRCATCGEPATVQVQREGTDEEAAVYHKATDDWRASNGLPPMPEDAAIRRVPVLVAEHRCDEHDPSNDGEVAT